MVKNLYKTTIVIWSKEDGEEFELSTLAREAETGWAYCSTYRSKFVEEPDSDPDWDGTDFFDSDLGDEDDLEGDDVPAAAEES